MLQKNSCLCLQNKHLLFEKKRRTLIGHVDS